MASRALSSPAPSPRLTSSRSVTPAAGPPSGAGGATTETTESPRSRERSRPGGRKTPAQAKGPVPVGVRSTSTDRSSPGPSSPGPYSHTSTASSSNSISTPPEISPVEGAASKPAGARAPSSSQGIASAPGFDHSRESLTGSPRTATPDGTRASKTGTGLTRRGATATGEARSPPPAASTRRGSRPAASGSRRADQRSSAVSPAGMGDWGAASPAAIPAGHSTSIPWTPRSSSLVTDSDSSTASPG